MGGRATRAVRSKAEPWNEVGAGLKRRSVVSLTTPVVDRITLLGPLNLVNHVKTRLKRGKHELGISIAFYLIEKHNSCVTRNFQASNSKDDRMTYSKLPQLLKRVAFTLVACASVAVLSTEQASAQSYGNRGGSFGRGSGISVNVGNLGLSVGFNNNRGFSGNRGYNNVKRPYSPGPKASYYRPPVKSYGNRGGGYGAACPYGGRGRY